MARASAFQAEGRRFESGFPLHLWLGLVIDTTRPRSSVVEHFLGKEEVIGSIPIVGSRFPWRVAWVLILIRILNVFRLGMTASDTKFNWEL